MTVADLKKKGATQLGDAQLKALIVGKAFWVRNNVTGEQFSVRLHDRRPRQRLARRQERRHCRAACGNLVRDGYQGTTTPYKIEGGKLVTTISQDPFAVTIYKLGDTYYGARSNEFGYANYEIIPTPQFAVNPLTAMINQFSIELGLTGTTEAADCPHPEAGGASTGGFEEEDLAQTIAENRAVEANRRLSG